MIFHRYISQEIRRPLFPVLSILVAVFGGYSAASFLSDAVNGLLPTDTIAELVGLKVLIALEVLIPVALYISVVLSFSKLYTDLEFTAAYALRVTPARVRGAVLTLSASLALLVGTLSLFVRPWAYGKLHEITLQAESSINVNAMEAGTFYVGEHGNRVIFLAHRDGPKSPARDVFVQLWQGDKVQIIHAKQAFALPKRPAQKGPRIYLRDAHMYQMDLGRSQDDRIMDAGSFVINPDPAGNTTPGYSSLSASSLQLAKSGAAADVAELQWRLSTPISTLLLGMLGIPMSRLKRKQGRSAKLGAAVLIYLGYYILCTSARTWVQHGSVAAFPGLWWVPALLSLFLLLALFGPNRHSEFSPGRA